VFQALKQNIDSRKFVNVNKNDTVVTRLVMTQDIGFYEQEEEKPLP
jgi:hypothetical protein